MILNIMSRKDPILTTKCDSYNFERPTESAYDIAVNLVETMREHGAPMIAANEVGLNVRVIALDTDPALVMFNPVITSTFGDETVLEETDLARRGLTCKMKRPGGVRIRFQDYNGDYVTERYVGMTARQILHGTETINGAIFYNKAQAHHRSQALQNFKKYERSLDRG